MDDPAGHSRTAHQGTVLTEGGNGLADITLDPLKTIEKTLPTSQKDLIQEEHRKLSLGTANVALKLQLDDKGQVAFKSEKTLKNIDDDDDGIQTDEDMQEYDQPKETPRSEYARLERTRAEQEKILWEKRQAYLKQ